MATEHAARTDTIVIKIEGTDIRLSVTTRYPLNQEDPPSDEQLARIRTGTIMRYTKMYKQAFQWQAWEYDAEAKSPLRVVAESEQTIIQPSAYDPYVTVWQQHWGQNNPPSLTLHDWDSGNAILALNKACEMSNDVLVKVFQQAQGIDLVYMSRFAVQSQPQHQTPPPPASGTIGTSGNPIGRNAESGDEPTPSKATVNLRPYIRSTRKGLADGLIAIETGKAKSPNFGTNAIIATRPHDYKNVQYDAGVYVAYALNGAITVNSYKNDDESVTLSANIPVLPTSNIRIFDKGSENNYDWSSLAQSLGVPKVADNPAIGLREMVGQSLSVDADYVVMKITGSANKKFVNFFGLYHAPEFAQQQTPQDERKPVTDDFPM